MDIYLFGSPQNYDNSPTEHGLIDTAKRPGDHAQKSKKMFVSQVTKRLLETMLIKKQNHHFYNHEKQKHAIQLSMNSQLYLIRLHSMLHLMKMDCAVRNGWGKNI